MPLLSPTKGSEDGEVTAIAYVMAMGYEKLLAEPTKYYLNIIWKGYVDNKISLRILREGIAQNQKEIGDIEG